MILLEKQTPAKCFPSVATVKVENGKSVTMSELQIGDAVQTGTNIKKKFYWLDH